VAFITFPAKLRFRELVTPTVLHLGFERQDGEILEFKPGQFINLHFDAGDGPTHRSYSVANPPGQAVFEIAISPVPGGLATQRLFELKAGDAVQISGPYGRFILRDDPPCRYVLVGTGTGITPYRAMLPQLAGLIASGHASAEIVVGVRSREEFLFAPDFTQAARDNPGLGLHARYSRQMPNPSQTWESRGYVQDLFADLDMNPERDIVYLCGNPHMVDAASAWLKEHEFPVRRIRREKYVSANA
jgi:ferredoxin-NADP reductase